MVPGQKKEDLMIRILFRSFAKRVTALGACSLMVMALSLVMAQAQDQGTMEQAEEMKDAVLEGQILDALGMEVEGVTAKLFRDSFFVTETTTDIEGNYRLSFQYNPALDKTLVVWFLPQEAELIPELLVLRESFQSKEIKLLSPCLPRIEISEQMTYNTELMDEKSKLESLSESDCFKEEKSDG
jgi:hypothetical protein